MKISSLIASRPVLVFIFLAFVVLLLPSIVIPCWYRTMKHIEKNVGLIAENLHLELISEIERTAKIFHPINSSAINLARVLGSSFNNSQQLSFEEIKSKVAPVLFQAFSVIPHVAQVSYIGLDGLFFSVFTDGNQSRALYSNSTFPSNSSTSVDYTWYIQNINQETGDFYGEAGKFQPLDAIRMMWFRRALNTTDGYATIGTGWGKSHDNLFLEVASVNRNRGVMSLGFPVKALTDPFRSINLYGGELYLSTTDGKMLLQGSSSASFFFSNNSVCFPSAKPHGDYHPYKVHCVPSNDKPGILEVGYSTYKVYCSVLEIAGVPLVYVLMFPHKELVSLVTKNGKFALILLALMFASAIISIFSFVFLMVRAAKREMHLCATLINQMEATQQAERKSMNKSLALASASHDIRASLAGIMALIDLSSEEVKRGSELETNLKQMQRCTEDLVGLLNSILDMSKIEAGKMQLEEDEFNLAELLEDVVDFFHPSGMKNGVDVVLDLCDGSILKFPHVRGDRGKLKQILNNLLSNAVKFTSEGHISLRGWAQKPSSESSIVIASNQNRNFLRFLGCLFYKNKDTRTHIEAVDSIRQNTNTMEFVFEVDDTGRGIPKEKQKSVFENYVQVRETGQGQQGTGLGLGIVQSLVRLMGGEIRIVDKEIGQKGTCFRFNVLLTTCETPPAETALKPDIEAKGDYLSTPSLGLTIRTSNHSRSRSIRSLSPRLNILSSSPKPEGSRVVLLIKDEERRRIAQKYVESLGVNVTVVDKWENLGYELKRINSKLKRSPQNSMGKVEYSARSDYASSSSKEAPLSVMEGTDQKIAVSRRRSNMVGFVLLVIDASAGPSAKLQDVVRRFRGRMQASSSCKVVWLNKHHGGNRSEDGNMDDVSFSKPLHGSRLHQVIKLLPEFGGALPKEVPPRPTRASMVHNELSLPRNIKPSLSDNETRVVESPRNSVSPALAISRRQEESNKEEPGNGGFRKEKPLRGKRILVVDDTELHSTIIRRKLAALGASDIDNCKNGAEAVSLVSDSLRQQRQHGSSYNKLPYDYIFMDCEMPEMDGYEATRQIREEEREYGVHIPIIAVTAHTSGPEASKTILAGMDVRLEKGLPQEQLMEAIKCGHSKQNKVS